MKKLSPAAIGVLAVLLVTVLVIRNLPESNPAARAAAAPAAKQVSSAEPGGLAPSAAAGGDPNLFKKIVERHEEQARAQQARDADQDRARWEKKVADFEDSLKEEPGVKKFGTALQIHSIRPNETVIMAGWPSETGKHMLVFITPLMLDPAGNRDAPPSDAQSVVQIDSKFVSVSDQLLVKLGLQTLFADQNEHKDLVRCSDPEFRSFINTIEQSDQADLFSTPRVTTTMGNEAQVSVQDIQIISGKNQALGPAVDLLPTLDEDGMFLDLAVLARYTLSANGTSQ